MSDAKASLAELAEDFGVSIERVRQIEQAALRKLRSLVATD
jgi:RNA polymerase sigma-32 factor